MQHWITSPCPSPPCKPTSRRSSAAGAAAPRKPSAPPTTCSPPTSPATTATASSACRATSSGSQEGKVFAGRASPIVTETPTHAVVDGNQGLGQTVAPQAVDLGIAKARAAGLAVIALRNAGHIGRIGGWAERACRGRPGLDPFRQRRPRARSSPRSAASNAASAPTRSASACPQPASTATPTLLLDLATSIVAEGKVLVASNGGKPIPHDALVTADGRLSSDPADFYGPLEGTHIRDPGNGTGALRAFGDHKGSAIAFMCEILAGCFAGSPTAGPLDGGKRGGIVNGMLSIYLDPDHFGAAGFAETARDFADYVTRDQARCEPGPRCSCPASRNPETRAKPPPRRRAPASRKPGPPSARPAAILASPRSTADGSVYDPLSF